MGNQLTEFINILSGMSKKIMELEHRINELESQRSQQPIPKQPDNDPLYYFSDGVSMIKVLDTPEVNNRIKKYL